MPCGVCVISYGVEPLYLNSSVSAGIWANKRAYCSTNGYRCILGKTRLTDRPSPRWDKVQAMMNALDRKGADDCCTWAVWVNPECVILKPTPLPINSLPLNTSLAFARAATGLNTAVIFARAAAPAAGAADGRIAAAFLRESWADTHHSHFDPEQKAMSHLLHHGSPSGVDYARHVSYLDAHVAYPEGQMGSEGTWHAGRTDFSWLFFDVTGSGTIRHNVVKQQRLIASGLRMSTVRPPPKPRTAPWVGGT